MSQKDTTSPFIKGTSISQAQLPAAFEKLLREYGYPTVESVYESMVSSPDIWRRITKAARLDYDQLKPRLRALLPPEVATALEQPPERRATGALKP